MTVPIRLDRRLQPDTARTALLDGLCHSLTRRARQANGAHLVSSVFRRLLATMPLRLLVILLGRLLPLLQSTAVPAPLLQASGKSASGKPVAASLMHTMARLIGHQYGVTCHARSADTCSLREYYLLFQPPITNLGHFHPRRQPPSGSTPDGNTRFAPGTLLLFKGELTFSHLNQDGPTPPVTQQDGVTIAVRRGRHSFTHATERIPLPSLSLLMTTLQCQPSVPLTQRCQAPMPSWIRDSGRTSRMSATPRPGQQACSPSSSMRRTANKPNSGTSMRGRERMMPTRLPPLP